MLWRVISRLRCGNSIGIVQAMGNLDDMAALGSALALALLTTPYGVFGANVTYFPVSAKLKPKIPLSPCKGYVY